MTKSKDIWIKCWVKTFFQTSKDHVVTQVFCKTRLRIYHTQFNGRIDPSLAIHWAKQLFETEILNTLDGSDSTYVVSKAEK